MDLKQKTETIGFNDNQDWLGSRHGVDTAETVTLDAANLLAAYPSGEVPSGVEIGLTNTGRHVLGHDSGTSDHGFLLHAVMVTAGSNPAGAKLWHGKVIKARVPLPSGGSVPVAGNHPHIRLV